MQTTAKSEAKVENYQGIAQDLADGLSSVAGQAAIKARQASDGVTELRALIRHQPITLAVLLLGLGYVFGRLAAGRHRRDT